MDNILALFPEARVICVRRESRNVVASYLRSPLLPDDLALALAHTRLSVEAGARAVARGQALDVSYEALTRRPEAVLRTVADWIGEPFEEAMLRPGMRDSSFGGGQLWEREEGIGIERDPDEADKWRKALSEEEGRIVRSVVDGEPGPVPWRLRLRVARHTAALRLVHARNRAGLYSLKAPGGPRG